MEWKTMLKFGLTTLMTGALLLLTTSPGNTETPNPNNPFTKHGLPVPGAYFDNKAHTQPRAVAASTSVKGQNPKPSKSETKKQTTPARYANS
jgi:hypothetical protein